MSETQGGEKALPPSDRVRLRRKPDRGSYDRAAVDEILDAATVGHVGFVVDGQPYVIPTAIWRSGDRLFWHGSAGSRMVRETKHGAPVCVTATFLDGFVMARSGTNHSFNYRSVVVIGHAYEETDPAKVAEALDDFVEGLFPGRAAQLRPMTELERKQTAVLWMDLNEASAKVRDGGVKDEPEDFDWPVWAGVVPLSIVAGAPIPDEHVPAGMPIPDYVPKAGQRIDR